MTQQSLIQQPLTPQSSVDRASKRRPYLIGVGAALAVGTTAALLLQRSRAQEYGTGAMAPQDNNGSGIDYPPSQSLTVTTDDGTELHVVISGKDTDPTVVLAHGWMATHRMWSFVTQGLLDAGYRVIAYDQRGHGNSTWTTANMSIDRLGNDLYAILEATGLLTNKSDAPNTSTRHGAILVGHSMGGMTVQSLLTQRPEVQSHLGGAVLVSTSARPSPVAVPLWLTTLTFGNGRTRSFERQALSDKHSGFGLNPDPSHIRLAHEMVLSTQGTARAACLSALSNFDVRKQLHTVQVPVQVVVGSLDRLTRVAKSDELIELLPDGELTVVNSIGHLLPLEDPTVVIDAVTALHSSRHQEGS